MKRKIRRHWRSVFRAGLARLPAPARHWIYREMIGFNLNPSPLLQVRLAQSREELEAAFRLLHDAYVCEGYMAPHPSGLRVTLYHALPSTSTIVAIWDGKVVGTLSIIRNNPLRLPLDRIFDTSKLKSQGARVAEISALAVDRSFRGNHGEILFPLIKYLYEYCISYFGVEYMLIAVNPKQADFYEGILFFQRIEEQVVKYEFVNGAPAVGMYLDLRAAYHRAAALYAAKPSEKNLFRYFTAVDLPNLVFPDRKYFKICDPVMTPELLEYFFNVKVPIFPALHDDERKLLARVYDHEKYALVLPNSQKTSPPLSRESKRFDVHCRGRIVFPQRDQQVRVTVHNVSLNGFCARLESPVQFGDALTINIAIGDFDIADVRAVPIWSDKRGVYGFRVTESSRNWNQFVGHLTKDLDREIS